MLLQSEGYGREGGKREGWGAGVGKKATLVQASVGRPATEEAKSGLHTATLPMQYHPIYFPTPPLNQLDKLSVGHPSGGSRGHLCQFPTQLWVVCPGGEAGSDNSGLLWVVAKGFDSQRHRTWV